MLMAGVPLWVVLIVDMAVEEMLGPSREVYSSRRVFHRSIPLDFQRKSTHTPARCHEGFVRIEADVLTVMHHFREKLPVK